MIRKGKLVQSRLATDLLSLLVICMLMLSFCACQTNPKRASSPVWLDVDVDPFGIDSSDQTHVKITMSDITVDNFVIKVRFPKALEYVIDSSLLVLNNVEYDAGPVTRTADSTYNYLIYFFSKNDLIQDQKAILQIVLKGVKDLPVGKVEVDADLDDPKVSNNTEFNVRKPLFTAQAFDDVRVGPPPPQSTS